MPKKLFLIDGNSFCYRAFYAIKELSTSKGQPTNAIYGFVTMLNKLIKEEKPDYLAVAFDLAGPTFRHKKYEEYKAGRKPMPDRLTSQFPLIKQILAAYDIPIFEKEGYEADDVLATIAKKVAKAPVEVYIATGDKDALQLIDDKVKVYSPHKDGIIYDRAGVRKRYGVEPEGMTEIMALMGDQIDNIPGVPGIGEKTAVELIHKFGSLEELLSSLDRVESQKRRELLSEFQDQARLSKELATVDRDVPLHLDLEGLKLAKPDTAELFRIFRELEFKRLLSEFAPREAKCAAHYRLVSSREEFDHLLKKLKGVEGFCLDFETTHRDPMKAELVGCAFSWKAREAYYVPLNIEGLEGDYVFGQLKPVFEDEKKEKYGQNIKYEFVLLTAMGIELRGIAFDTMVASYLLNPSKPNHNLDDISLEYLGHKMIALEELIGKGKDQLRIDQVDLKKVCEYACEDADITMRLKEILEGRLKEKDLYDLFLNVEMPLIEVLARMEMAGIAIDTRLLHKMSGDMERDLGRLTDEIYDIAGQEFNINSPKQLGRILFEKLRLPVIKRTKTGASTDVEVLAKLAKDHTLPRKLLEYRELAKLKSTYIDALPQLLNPKTGRVHTSFNQTVTATGRLSSSGPNLQNVPIRTETGREIRKAFVAQVNSVLLSADYSQIELRILAHLSGDANLIRAFRDDLDIHTHTASLVFGVREADVTAQMRDQAKTVNFGINYGMSPYGLSKSLGIGIDEASNFIDAYFAKYPKVRDYIDQQIQDARSKGYVTTLLNRRRYIPEIKGENKSLREFAERTAMNTPVQGSAADLIKVAMIRIDKELRTRTLRTKMILQVHDELVFEVPKDEQGPVEELVKEKMEKVIELKVPIRVKTKVGRNWFEAK